VVRGIDTVSSCYECFTKLSKGQNFYLFDDFGEIPDCVKSLKSYNEYRKLAIGWLFCSTFKPPCYTYLHSVGDIWFNKDPRVFRGMVGLLYEGQNKELSTTSTDLKKVLMWFQKNNKLYKEFSAILKQLLVILSLFLHHPLLLMYPVLLKILKLQKEGNSRSLILKSKKVCFSQQTNSYPQ
jgi:hypothetical protein